MHENYVMKMAKFIHSHPELQMLPPRVWRTHYEDECKEEMKISSFSSLKQYPSLVRIYKPDRYNLYGSAKIPASAKVLPHQSSESSSTDLRQKRQSDAAVVSPQQLKLENLSESLSAQIERVMSEATTKIQQIIKIERTIRSSEQAKRN